MGVIYVFEEWLRPAIGSGALIGVLEPWWQSFSGPFLYFPGRRLLPAPLRAFVDFIKNSSPSVLGGPAPDVILVLPKPGASL